MDETLISKIIRSERKSLGLTQQNLADLSGTSMILISQIERGKTTVRLDKLIPILTVLGLEICIKRGKSGITVQSEDSYLTE